MKCDSCVGPTGATGLVGATGPSGLTGSGVIGEDGATGLGLPGGTGPTGVNPQGSTGTTGIDGSDNGPIGVTGAIGSAGTGAFGATGVVSDLTDLGYVSAWFESSLGTTLPAGSICPFNNLGPINSVTFAANTFQVLQTGVWRIRLIFRASILQPIDPDLLAQVDLRLNGSIVVGVGTAINVQAKYGIIDVMLTLVAGTIVDFQVNVNSLDTSAGGRVIQVVLQQISI